MVLARGEIFGDEECVEALLAVDVRQARLAVVLAVRHVPCHLVDRQNVSCSRYVYKRKLVNIHMKTSILFPP